MQNPLEILQHLEDVTNEDGSSIASFILFSARMHLRRQNHLPDSTVESWWKLMDQRSPLWAELGIRFR